MELNGWMTRSFAHHATRRLAVPAAQAHAAIEDLGCWNAWSPFYAMDPEAVTTVSPRTAGVGAHYTWDGRRSGRGTLTVQDSTAPSTVVMRVAFLAPIATESIAQFDVVSQDGHSCSVTWTMKGQRPLWLALLAWATGMDRQMVGHFLEGLTALERHILSSADGSRSSG